jgi:hypothetical protein
MLSIDKKYMEFNHEYELELKEIKITEEELSENFDDYMDKLGVEYDTIIINCLNGEKFVMMSFWIFEYLNALKNINKGTATNS